jgi:uncharacterized protein (TIGR02145 family)
MRMEGLALKSTYNWENNGNGTDNFGYNGLHGGWRGDILGNYESASVNGNWWSSEYGVKGAHFRSLFYRVLTLHKSQYTSCDYPNKSIGHSVRCIKDSIEPQPE